MRGPIDRITEGLPSPWPTAIDWVVTIVVAVGAVLAIKAWVVNPYRIPSSSMEPTLHCAAPGAGCQARFSDRVLANRFIYHFRSPHRQEIVVFKTPPAAERCENGAGGETFVKRIIGLPGETIRERRGTILVNGKPLVSRSAAGQTRISLDEPIALERSSWVGVRALGPWHRLVLNDAGAFAHSSPVYVYFGDQPIAFRGDVRFYIDWIERLIARVKDRGRFTTAERRAEVVALFERALGKYRQIEATAAP